MAGIDMEGENESLLKRLFSSKSTSYGSGSEASHDKETALSLSSSSSSLSLTTQNQLREAALLLIEGDASFRPSCCFKRKCWQSQEPCYVAEETAPLEQEPQQRRLTDSSFTAGTATIPNEIFNLVKNIVGSGGLSLPSGIATFANAPSALLPCLGLILIMGILNAYSFSLIGRVCAITKARTYKEAWERSYEARYNKHHTIGKPSWTSQFVAMVVVGKTLLGCWGFSIVISSTCQPLLQRLLLWIFEDSTTIEITRAQTLWIVTVLVLLPLCLKETLAALAPFSVVGQFGTLFTAMTMVIRYFDGSYKEGSTFYNDLAPQQQPLFGDRGVWSFFTSPQTLILVSILSTGYVAHYNAPKYFYELKDHTTGRFNVVVNISFVLSALTYGIISSLGFLTFGENSAGFILDNYSIRDPLANISRFGIALSVLFAYPLLFLGGRDGILDLLGQGRDGEHDISEASRRWNVTLLSVSVLALITTLAIMLDDLTLVLSVGGATLSTCIIYIFPPLMFQATIVNCTCKDTAGKCWEVKVAKMIFCLGIVLGVCGAVVSVWRAL